jgi:hypothetical protein
MKLPTYHSGAVQSLDTVDPSVYRELGRAQTQFGQAIGQAGEELADHYVKVSTAEKIKGETELRVRGKQFRDYLTRNEYTDVRDAPSDIVDSRFVETREDGSRVVPTRLIADQWYKKVMDEESARIAGESRTKLAGDWITESYQQDIAPYGEVELTSIIYDQDQRAAKVSAFESFDALIKGQDAEGLSKAIHEAQLANIITSEEGAKIAKDGVNNIQFNSYLDGINAVDQGDEHLVRMKKDIDDDKILSPEQKRQLQDARGKAILYNHEKRIDRAAAEMNYAALGSMEAHYRNRQYDGPLNGDERRTMLDKIESAKNRLEGNDKRAKAMAYAQMVDYIRRPGTDYDEAKAQIYAGIEQGLYEILADPEKLANADLNAFSNNTSFDYYERALKQQAELDSNPAGADMKNKVINGALDASGFVKPTAKKLKNEKSQAALQRRIEVEGLIRDEIERIKINTGREATRDEVTKITAAILTDTRVNEAWTKKEIELSDADVHVRTNNIRRFGNILSGMGLPVTNANLFYMRKAHRILREADKPANEANLMEAYQEAAGLL